MGTSLRTCVVPLVLFSDKWGQRETVFKTRSDGFFTKHFFSEESVIFYVETKHINCELVSSTCQQACLQKPKQPSLLNCWSCDQINTRKFIPNTPETRDNKHGVQTGTAAACSLLCRFISSHISIANAKITGPVKLDWILWNLITPTYTQASWWRLKKMKEKKIQPNRRNRSTLRFHEHLFLLCADF